MAVATHAVMKPLTYFIACWWMGVDMKKVRLQMSPKEWAPGCENFALQARQMCLATAGIEMISITNGITG